MPGHAFGLDLGTNYCKISDHARQLVTTQHHMIALKKQEVVAAGDAAFLLYEKVSDKIQVTRPIRHGVIADVTNGARLLDYCLRLAGCSNRMFSRNEFFFAVPSAITEVQKRAFFGLISRSDFKSPSVYIVEKPIAVALGEGLDVNRLGGIMVADFGADTTEISVIAQGGIVLSVLKDTGGNQINEAIISALRFSHNLVVGFKTAENLKQSFMNLLNTDMADSYETVPVYGRDLLTGLPVQIHVSINLVAQAAKSVLDPLADSIQDILARTPPEFRDAVSERGICVTGGTSRLPGFSDWFSSRVRMRVQPSSSPQESAVRGLDTIIRSKELRTLAFSVKESVFTS